MSVADAVEGRVVQVTDETRLDEIADGIFRISTYVAEVAPPAGFTFNQFLVMADQPLLFHTGPRALFPVVSTAVSQVLAPDRLRWLTFGHVESDETGGMNQWLQAAPGAEVVANPTACQVSLDDLADRPPQALDDGEVLDLGDQRVRLLYTPHVPHNWEAQILYEETSGTLLCGDLFTHIGDRGPVVNDDIVEPAIDTDGMFQADALSARGGATLRRLAALEPTRLALMHGAAFEGDCVRALCDLASWHDEQVRSTLERGLPTGNGGPCPTV